MSVKMKLGIWQDGHGTIHVVDVFDKEWKEYPFASITSAMNWNSIGEQLTGIDSKHNLVRFISDLPGTASAEPGAAGSPTVSTGDPQQALRRMRKTESAMRAEAQAHHDAYEAVTRAADDLEAEIIRLEKEVEG